MARQLDKFATTFLEDVKVNKIGLRVRFFSENPDREPQGTITDAGYGAVTITWDDTHRASNIPRPRWPFIEVL